MVCNRTAAWCRRSCRCTVIAQGVSGIGITIAALWKNPQLFPKKEQRIFRKTTFSEVGRYAFFTCLQQSVMNFGILMIQGLVNSFGTAIMAAFAAAVKSIRWHTCRCRNLAMPFPCLSPRIMVPTSGSGNRRNPHCGSRVDSFLRDHFRCCLDLCPSINADFCGCR